MDILVQEATVDDAELIVELTRAAWAAKGSLSSGGHLETPERVVHDLQCGGGFILLVDNKPAGSARWVPLNDSGNVWEIVRMGILPAYRGQGLSQHLLEAVLHRALEADVDELRIAVDSDQTRLVDLYAAYGFDLAMELEYSDSGAPGDEPLIMRRLLHY